ncbi:MAG TPA: type II secretion system protein GspG [Myxococcales bacterium]|nr:type II secretion system protein GspG [Myxococcales bacterium]
MPKRVKWLRVAIGVGVAAVIVFNLGLLLLVRVRCGSRGGPRCAEALTLSCHLGLCLDPEWQVAELDLRAYAQALEAFRGRHRRYPSTREGLAALYELAGGTPKRDPWGHPYVYVSPGERHPESYDLASLGADGAPGGKGDDADLIGR